MPPRSSSTADLLSTRALNRATLERQMLLRRADLSVEDAVERLVGLQSQAPIPPYFGLWTRMERFAPDDLSARIVDRRLVRMALMRSTIHLVSARDALMLRPLVQPVLVRAHLGTYGKRLEGLDPEEVAAAGRALLEERPRTPGEVGALLAGRFPGRDPAALSGTVRALVPLVQLPPRGLWGAGGQATHTTVEAWLGRSPDPDPDPAEMLARYLAAFGPATVRDAQTWSGLTRLRDAAARLGDRLRAFRDEAGRELLDLAEAPRPDPDTPAPPRFLPEWDNLLLSHADRSRVISEADRARVYTVNGILHPTLLLDGAVRGMWKIERGRGTATLVVEPFAKLSKADRAAVADEGARLLAFAAPGEAHDVRLTPPAKG